MMLWLEMEGKGESKFSAEVKLIGGEFAVYAETVSDESLLHVMLVTYEYSVYCLGHNSNSKDDTL